MNSVRYLCGIFAFVCLFVGFGNDASAQQRPIPLPRITPPKILDYAPRQPSFSIPQYYYPCRQINLHFPTGEEFARTLEAKRNLNAELDFIYSNGDSVPNKLNDIYDSLVDNIVEELAVAPKSKMGLAVILNFEKAVLSIEECGRALGAWDAGAPKLRKAFGNYYSLSQNEFKESFQIIAQSKLSRRSLFIDEAFLIDFGRSNFISPDLSAALASDIGAANARLIDARNQYLGTYFAQGVVDKDKCFIEDDEVRLRGRIDTQVLYPLAAIRKEIEGEVILKLNVDNNGKATNVEFGLVSHEIFRSEAILSAFYKADFWPKIMNCVTMPGIATQKLFFRMDR